MKSIFIQAIIIGLAIAAPVGPIGILCIRTTIAKGILAGLAVGFGAAAADGFYVIIGGLGLGIVIKILLGIAPILKVVGGVFLLFIGTKIFLKKVSYSKTETEVRKSYGRLFSSTFFLTLSNPMTILTFLGVISAMEVEMTTNFDLITLILGVFLGSILWWVFLVTIVSIVAKRLSVKVLSFINKLAGLILIGFGIYILGWA